MYFHLWRKVEVNRFILEEYKLVQCSLNKANQIIYVLFLWFNDVTDEGMTDFVFFADSFLLLQSKVIMNALGPLSKWAQITWHLLTLNDPTWPLNWSTATMGLPHSSLSVYSFDGFIVDLSKWVCSITLKIWPFPTLIYTHKQTKFPTFSTSTPRIVAVTACWILRACWPHCHICWKR